jgi:FKBP-type peptidyl-prolyl cis-trans isomerase FkpA
MSMRAFALLTMAVVMSGCGDSNTVTNPTTPPPSGIAFSATDLQVGTGAEAMAGRRLTVNYSGWLYDASRPDNKGQQFDSGQNFQFTLGAGQVIAGWDQGFTGMREGGLRRLVLPPELAYGSSGAGGGVIPPNATLVFDVELVDVS